MYRHRPNETRSNQARFVYAVSRVNIILPTEAIARYTSKLLAAAGLHGHQYAPPRDRRRHRDDLPLPRDRPDLGPRRTS